MSGKKTLAEQMDEANKAFRDLWDAMAAVYIKTAKEINAACKKGQA